MQLLFYSGRSDENTRRLETAVHEAIPEDRIELFNSLDDFQKRLRRPIEPDSIAVLSSNPDELRQMQPLRRLLVEIYVVLVIPDRKKLTIRLAHRFLPRFLTRHDGDFGDLKIVLNKMYSNSRCRSDENIRGDAA